MAKLPNDKVVSWQSCHMEKCSNEKVVTWPNFANWQLCQVTTLPCENFAMWQLFHLNTFPCDNFPWDNFSMRQLCHLATWPCENIVMQQLCHVTILPRMKQLNQANIAHPFLLYRFKLKKCGWTGSMQFDLLTWFWNSSKTASTKSYGTTKVKRTCNIMPKNLLFIVFLGWWNILSWGLSKGIFPSAN